MVLYLMNYHQLNVTHEDTGGPCCSFIGLSPELLEAFKFMVKIPGPPPAVNKTPLYL